jgi:hypothetical protein
MPPTPVTDQPGFRLCSALIIDVGIRALHGVPQPGQTWMKEAQSRDTEISPVTLEGPDPTDLLAVRLPVVNNYESDAISSSDQLRAEKDLLSLGSADVCDILSLGEGCVSLW